MTTFTTSPVTGSPRSPIRARVARIGLRTVRVVLSAQFVVGGVLKLSAAPAMVAMFDDIGAGQWLRILVGCCEIAGAIGLLVGRLTRLAAIGLAGLMIGATVTNLVALQAGPGVPLVLFALATLIATTTEGSTER